MKKSFVVCAVVGVILCPIPANARTPDSSTSNQMAAARSLLSSLHPVRGDIALADAKATLHLGESYYFIPAAEARRVLVEGWGNPPDSANGVLGMVFPTGKTFLDDVWGAVITYNPMGYVSDKDAQDTNYDELLSQLQEAEPGINAERSKLGYPAQHLVGWAQTPTYDGRSHSVIWARNIHFDGQPQNTLNYDVRLLGRYGVLSLNMITNMPRLGETRDAANSFGKAASFDRGAAYADFKPGVDLDSGLGVAGLVAAGVGVAAAKKIGLLAIILAFGKKAIILLLAAGAAIAGRFRRMFGRANTDDLVYADTEGDLHRADNLSSDQITVPDQQDDTAHREERSF
jgi:uncharacterized membrane-anchored protein